MVIAIVDSGGHLVLLHRLDNTQLGSVTIAQRKAETALYFRRSTKVFDEAVTAGGAGLRFLSVEACVLEGGLLIVQDDNDHRRHRCVRHALGSGRAGRRRRVAGDSVAREGAYFVISRRRDRAPADQPVHREPHRFFRAGSANTTQRSTTPAVARDSKNSAANPIFVEAEAGGINSAKPSSRLSKSGSIASGVTSRGRCRCRP